MSNVRTYLAGWVKNCENTWDNLECYWRSSIGPSLKFTFYILVAFSMAEILWLLNSLIDQVEQLREVISLELSQ